MKVMLNLLNGVRQAMTANGFGAGAVSVCLCGGIALRPVLAARFAAGKE